MDIKAMTLYALLKSGQIRRARILYDGTAEENIAVIVQLLDRGGSLPFSSGELCRKQDADAFYFDVPDMPEERGLL